MARLPGRGHFYEGALLRAVREEEAMKKTLALVLTVLLLLGSACARGEAAAATGKVTLEDTLLEYLLIPAEAWGGADAAADVRRLFPALKDLAGRTSFRLTAGREGVFLEALTDDTQVFWLRGRKEAEDGWVFISSLIPHYALTLSPEAKKAPAGEQAAEAGEKEAPSQTPLGPLERLTQELLGSAGEMSFGEFQFSGWDFDLKIPVEVSAVELAEKTLRMLRETFPRFSFLPGELPSALRQRLEDAELDLSFFGAVDRLSGRAAIPYAVCVLEDENVRVHLEGGIINGEGALHLEIGAKSYEDDGQLKSAAQEGAEDAFALDLFLVPGKNALGIEMDVFSRVFLAVVSELYFEEKNAGSSWTRMYIGTADAPVMEARGTWTREAAAPESFETGDRQRIALEELAREAGQPGPHPLRTALAEDAARCGAAWTLRAAAQAAPEAAAEITQWIRDRGLAEEAREDGNALLRELLHSLEADPAPVGAGS